MFDNDSAKEKIGPLSKKAKKRLLYRYFWFSINSFSPFRCCFLARTCVLFFVLAEN